MSHVLDKISAQTLALAGVFQAVEIVRAIAREGKHDIVTRDAMIETVFRIDADSVEAVYENTALLATGLHVLNAQLGGTTGQRDFEVSRYAAQILALQANLVKKSAAMQKIQSEIFITDQQRNTFELNSVTLLARLAKIYSDNISTLSPRILIKGEQIYLENSDNANSVRALLLAGIRSAVLWQQMGGSRIKLLFQRKKYLQSVQLLQAEIESNPTN